MMNGISGMSRKAGAVEAMPPPAIGGGNTRERRMPK